MCEQKNPDSAISLTCATMFLKKILRSKFYDCVTVMFKGKQTW